MRSLRTLIQYVSSPSSHTYTHLQPVPPAPVAEEGVEQENLANDVYAIEDFHTDVEECHCRPATPCADYQIEQLQSVAAHLVLDVQSLLHVGGYCLHCPIA